MKHIVANGVSWQKDDMKGGGVLQGLGSLKRSLIPFGLAAFLSGCSHAPVEPSGPPPKAPLHLKVVREALSLRGIPYRYGEETPERGFDCSGLVQYVYGRYGVNLPRTAAEMADALPELEEAERKPGDLVFFNTTGKPYSHVGIYLGGERFVHASSAKGKVMVSDLVSPYWIDHYLGARRPVAGSLPETESIGRWIP